MVIFIHFYKRKQVVRGVVRSIRVCCWAVKRMRYFRNAQRSPRNTGRADGCERGRAGSKSRRLLVSTGGREFWWRWGDRRYGGLGDGSATERVRLCVTRGDRQEVRPRVRPVVPAVQKKRLSSRFFLTPPREIPGGGSPTRRGHKRVVVWKRR